MTGAAPARPDASYWCEHAWLGAGVLTTERGVLIEVAAGRIAALRADVPSPPRGAVALAGVTMPGLANAHSHAFHRGLRGRTHGDVGSFWTWRDQMYALANRLDPTSYRALARATFAEMACAGITCVGEFHYLHHGAGGTPYDEANAMGEAVRAAAAEAGVRLTLLDTCYLHGGIGVAPNETQRRFSDGDAHAWAARVEAMPASANMIVGAAIHSVRAVDPRASAIVADWAARAEAPLHAHVSEQPGENAHCQDAYGMSPIERLHRDGALSDRFTAVHATHLSEHDVALLAATHSVCCLCPTTERDLADGIGPTRQFRDSGIAMTLGSDSHAVIDLFEEARAVELDERLASLERGTHAPAALLTAATAAGYRSLGWPDGGRLTPGALADLTTISLDSVRLAGAPYDDLLAAVVYSGGAADVHHVVVGGKVIVRDGAHVQLDVPRELNTAITEVWS